MMLGLFLFASSSLYCVLCSTTLSNGELFVAPNPSATGDGSDLFAYVGYAPHISSMYGADHAAASHQPEDFVLLDDKAKKELSMDECVESLQSTLPAYRKFAVDLTGAQATVAEGESTLGAIQSVTQSLIEQEAEFSNRLGRLRVLYNTMASRSNTLSAWIQQEISVRDRLTVYLNALYELHNTEKTKISEMNDSIAASLRTLENVEMRSTSQIQKIANNQIALFSWSYNVTQSIDKHTVQLDSLASNTKIRITQINTATAEVKKLALVAKLLAVRYNEAHLSETADTILSRLGLTLDSTPSVASF